MANKKSPIDANQGLDSYTEPILGSVLMRPIFISLASGLENIGEKPGKNRGDEEQR